MGAEFSWACVWMVWTCRGCAKGIVVVIAGVGREVIECVVWVDGMIFTRREVDGGGAD